MKENLMVLFGGKSVEHDISIITALQVMKIAEKQFNIIPVYIQKNGKWCNASNLCDVDTYLDFSKNVKKKKEVFLKFGSPYLFVDGRFGMSKLCKIDCALMCLHGNYGEDGSICASLDMCNIPYTSSGHTSSAICMDKIFTKQILDSCQIKNAKYIFFNKTQIENFSEIKKKIKKELGFPVVVKPANLGSSVGISIVKHEDEFEEKVKYAFEFDNRILIEEYLDGAEEYNCACMTIDGEIISSKVIKVDKGELFSFEEKYIACSEKKPGKCSRKLEKEISKLAKEVYALFDCRGVVRIDFLEKDGTIFVNEINSIPGSLSLHMFSGISKREIVEVLVKEAKKNAESKEKCIFSFESDALKVFKDAIKSAKRRK